MWEMIFSRLKKLEKAVSNGGVGQSGTDKIVTIHVAEHGFSIMSNISEDMSGIVFPDSFVAEVEKAAQTMAYIDLVDAPSGDGAIPYRVLLGSSVKMFGEDGIDVMWSGTVMTYTGNFYALNLLYSKDGSDMKICMAQTVPLMEHTA